MAIKQQVIREGLKSSGFRWYSDLAQLQQIVVISPPRGNRPSKLVSVANLTDLSLKDYKTGILNRLYLMKYLGLKCRLLDVANVNKFHDAFRADDSIKASRNVFRCFALIFWLFNSQQMSFCFPFNSHFPGHEYCY